VAEDPANFFLRSLDTLDWLEGVAASEDRLVAVGDRGTVYVSTNAVDWERVASGTSKSLASVAYAASQFVAVGEAGFIATSQDGREWQPRSSGAAGWLNRVAWVRDHFVAVGDDGQFLTSDTGETWQIGNSGVTNPLYAIASQTNSTLLGGDGLLLLNRGSGFVNQTLNGTNRAPQWPYYAAVADSARYLASGRTGLLVEGFATNGSPFFWVERQPSIRQWLWQVSHLFGRYVAVGDYGTILTSPDGIDWEPELVPDAATNSVLMGVGGSTNLCLAVGNRGTILWGTNVFLWNLVTPRPTTNNLQGVAFDGETYVVCGDYGTILTSPDGTNWTRRPTGTSAMLSSVTPMDGAWVAVGEDGAILRSVDAETWLAIDSGTTNWLFQVRDFGGELVAVGEKGTILTSTDGEAWSLQNSGTTRWLNAVGHIEGYWFVVGNQGTVLASTSLTNWSSIGTATRKSLYGLAIHDGQLVTVGVEGIILRSQLIPSLLPMRIKFARASGQNLFLFHGQPDQRFVLQNTQDFTNWHSGPLLEFLDSSGTLIYLQESNPAAPPLEFYRGVTPP
jgi:hypothetical protein